MKISWNSREVAQFLSNMAAKSTRRDGDPKPWWFCLVVVLSGVCTYIYMLHSKGSSDLFIPQSTDIRLRSFEDQYLTEVSQLFFEQHRRDMAYFSEEMRKESQDNLVHYQRQMLEMVKASASPSTTIIPASNEKLSPQPSPDMPLIDFAQRLLGGRIHSHSKAHDHGAYRISIVSILIVTVPKRPVILIDENNYSEPGDCWAFVGSHGYVTIELHKQVNLTKLVYEHVDEEHTSNSTPRLIDVFVGKSADKLKRIGSMEFEHSTSSAQLSLNKSIPAKFVKFDVVANFGDEFTCMYRLKALGPVQ